MSEVTRRFRRIAPGIAVLLCLSSLVAACGGDGDSTPPASTPPTTSPTSTTAAASIGAPPPLKVTTVATLAEPVAMAQRKKDDTLFVAERAGVVRMVRNGIVEQTPALDMRNEVGSKGGEQGLLGIAFSPKTGKLYFNYTDLVGDTHFTEVALGEDGIADMRTRRDLLTQKQPFPNHNGGHMLFGPDGMLYIGLGDGGSAGDPQKNGQDLGTLLGKMLRINPEPSTELPYTIPFDNPYVKQVGARGEVWAFGLRNPWRYSFDRETEALWIGDVGQGKVEEIDVVQAPTKGGLNFGWSLREGTQKFSGDKPTDAVDPIYEYQHENGACSVTGGYVYRGTAIPDLKARYVFADYCNGQISTLTQRGTAWQADATTLKVPNVTSFGEDHSGEIYVLSQNGTVGRIEPA